MKSMKAAYSTPWCDILLLETKDVITTSPAEGENKDNEADFDDFATGN